MFKLFHTWFKHLVPPYNTVSATVGILGNTLQWEKHKFRDFMWTRIRTRVWFFSDYRWPKKTGYGSATLVKSLKMEENFSHYLPINNKFNNQPCISMMSDTSFICIHRIERYNGTLSTYFNTDIYLQGENQTFLYNQVGQVSDHNYASFYHLCFSVSVN